MKSYIFSQKSLKISHIYFHTLDHFFDLSSIILVLQLVEREKMMKKQYFSDFTEICKISQILNQNILFHQKIYVFDDIFENSTIFLK